MADGSERESGLDRDAIAQRFASLLAQQHGEDAQLDDEWDAEFPDDDLDLDDDELVEGFEGSEFDDPTGKLFTVYGWSGAGKTTFLEQVVAILAQRGLRVGTIKHHGHASPLDAPGKDSSRYASAGAACEVVSSATEYLVHRNPPEERTLLELALEIEDECDVIVAEGFKGQAINPVELYREAAGKPPIGRYDSLVAVITDSSAMAGQAQEHGVPVFALSDPAGFAGFLADMTGWRS